MSETGVNAPLAAQSKRAVSPPPFALERLPEIEARLRGRRLAAFLDYDGTLAPIVPRPEAAEMDAATRAALARLMRLASVAVVSGRDLEDVRARVGLELACAGCHGLEMSGPGGLAHVHPGSAAALPALEEAERRLRAALAGIGGALVERKRFSVAAHYREVAPGKFDAVERAVDAALAGVRGLRKTRGKRVFELLPDLDWGKGAAVLWLLESLGLDGADVLPLYVGDDLTDEDAFCALGGRGIAIAVLEEPRPTAAQYALRDTAEVRELVGALAAALERR